MTLKYYVNSALESIPSQTVLYRRRVGEYGEKNRKLMNDFKTWLKENDLYDENTMIYAIPMDSPEQTEPSRCRYDVCIQWPQNRAFVDEQIKCRNLVGGEYLVFLIPHTVDAIQNAWKMCFSELNESGYSLDGGRPVMERYCKRLVDNHFCELCVPIR